MNIVAIHGVEHKGSTYHIAKMVIHNLNADQITEFFLPKDMPHFCKGCGACFTKGEEFCPHYEQINSILKTIEQADVIIFTSPVYVYHCTGQMKAFLDHFGYQWIVHRPNKAMFSKTVLVISTAAGAGMKSTNKDITDSMYFWGIGRIVTYEKAVRAINWQGVSDKIKSEIKNDSFKLAEKIKKAMRKSSPSLKVKAWYYGMRFVNKKFPFNEIDRAYWDEQGLLKKKPWA